MYPKAFRQQVISYLRGGHSVRKTAAKFEVSPNTVQNWKRDIRSKVSNNSAPRKITKEMLLKDVEQYPDDYHYERARRLNCSKSTICANMKKFKISKKNSPTSSRK